MKKWLKEAILHIGSANLVWELMISVAVAFDI